MLRTNEHIAALQHIQGRDDGSSLHRDPIYRARVPTTWRRIDPNPAQSNADTTTSIGEFIIDDSDGPLRIAIHNFPADDLNERIPPMAQISRWQNQLSMSCSTASVVLRFPMEASRDFTSEEEGP